MSEFAVPILQLDDVVPHPNADRLDLAVVGGYRSVVPRGKFKTGDWVVYIPEGAVIPEWILEKEGLTGYLAGPNKDRVRAVKLRGELSQGIVMRASDYNGGNEPSIAADDISDALGIVKYEPPLPRQFAGRFAGAAKSRETGALLNITLKYDFDNIKKHPRLFDDDDIVAATEKLHGTCHQILWASDIAPRSDFFGVTQQVAITSKGIAKNGFFIANCAENDANVYVRSAKQFGLIDAVERLNDCILRLRRAYLFGEVFGDVQDLRYGSQPRSGELQYRLFDVFYVRDDGSSGFVDACSLPDVAERLGLMTVPRIFEGKWGELRAKLDDYTSGKSLLAPKQIREGIVIRTLREEYHQRLGRKIAKSVSSQYLLRNGQVTEYA